MEIGKKNFFGLTVVVLLCFAFAIGFFRVNSEDGFSEKRVSKNAIETEDSLRTESIELRGKLKKIESRNDELKHALSDIKKELALVHERYNSVQMEQKSILKTVEAVSDKAQAVAVKQENIVQESYVVPESISPEEDAISTLAEIQYGIGIMEDVVASEPTDEKWTYGAEVMLTKAFNGDDAVGIKSAESTCRTTICRVEIKLDEASASEESFRNIQRLMPWDGEGFVYIEEGNEVSSTWGSCLYCKGRAQPATKTVRNNWQ